MEDLKSDDFSVVFEKQAITFNCIKQNMRLTKNSDNSKGVSNEVESKKVYRNDIELFEEIDIDVSTELYLCSQSIIFHLVPIFVSSLYLAVTTCEIRSWGVPPYPKNYTSSYGYILIVVDELITAI